jgi:ATP-binding cassette subfamily C (CFTR/MRP) protein 1
VTNSISFLPQMDEIILLENGSIVEVGSFEELKKQNGEFVAFLNKYAENLEEPTNDDDDMLENNGELKLLKFD